MRHSLLQAHFVVLGLALLDFCLYTGSDISFQGQSLDIIFSVAPLLTAIITLFSHWRRRVSLALRIYFIAFIGGNLLLTPVYFFGTIIFHQPVHDRLGPYELRSIPGILASAGEVHIIRHCGVFEQVVHGRFIINPDSKARQLHRKGDSLYLTSVPGHAIRKY